MRDSVVLPAPDGEDSTNIRPRRSTPSNPWLPAAIASLQILYLFAELLDDVLHLEPGIGELDIVRLGAAGIDLAVEFLGEEIEPPPDRSALAENVARLRDMGCDAVKLLADVGLGCDQQRFLGQAVLIEAIGRLQQRRDLFGKSCADRFRPASGRSLGALCQLLDLVHSCAEHLPERRTFEATHLEEICQSLFE